jgi:hypothetical protein
MAMRRARIMIVLVGILVPYVARLPGGTEWLQQYTNSGFGGLLLLSAFNAIAWGALLAVSRWYQNPVSLLPSVLCGYGFLAWAHYSLDLASDAQAAIALVFIPVYALGPIAIGAVIGYVADRILRPKNAA